MEQYTAISIKIICLEDDPVFLTGSVTKDPVTPRTVDVHPMDNGFEGGESGFEELNFD